MTIQPKDRAARRQRGDEGRARAAARRWLVRFALWVAVLPAALCFSDSAATDRPTPGDVEAAYLYNFGKFVRWPEAASQGPLRICVAGSDSFEKALARLVSGERIGGRTLEASHAERMEDEKGCAILFVGSGERARLDAWLAEAAGKPILTVGDSSDFLARGGIIQFVVDENHVRFSVNLSAADHSGLSLSSELLKVAVSVVGGLGNGGAR